jgi:hypothetical protein
MTGSGHLFNRYSERLRHAARQIGNIARRSGAMAASWARNANDCRDVPQRSTQLALSIAAQTF